MTTEVSASSAQCLVCPSGDLLFQRYTLAQLSLLQERGQLTLPTCTNCFPDCMMREYLHQQALNQITAWSQQHVQVPAEVRGRAHPLFNYYRHNSISAVAPPRRFHVRSIIPVATKLTAVGTGVVERSIVGLKRPIATVTAGSQLMREYPSILRPRRVKARTGYWLGVKK